MVHSYIRFKRGARVRETMSNKYAEGTITAPTTTSQWIDLEDEKVHITWDLGGSNWVAFQAVEVI